MQTLQLGKVKWSLGGGVCRSLERGVGQGEFGLVSPELFKLLSRSWARPLLSIFMLPDNNIAYDSGLPLPHSRRASLWTTCGPAPSLHAQGNQGPEQFRVRAASFLPTGEPVPHPDFHCTVYRALVALGFSPLSVVLCSSVSYGTSLCTGL